MLCYVNKTEEMFTEVSDKQETKEDEVVHQTLREYRLQNSPHPSRKQCTHNIT